VFSAQAITLAFRSGPRLALDSTIPLMQHFRDAVLARLETPASSCLSGHAGDGSATTEPHLALVPLANVQGKHADGSLKGVALVLPRGAEDEPRLQLLAAVGDAWFLHLGLLGSISMELVIDEASELQSLRFSRYSTSSTCWATVTPIVLDRHPRAGRFSAEQIIATSCERIGLPPPVEIRTGAVSPFSRAPRIKEFRGQSRQTAGRVLMHALLRFEEEVRGPVLLGAGRFMGLGVCLPFHRREQG
jgi:CRISPR-associated protein Csb2